MVIWGTLVPTCFINTCSDFHRFNNNKYVLMYYPLMVGGWNNVQKLLHCQRECATVKIEYPARTADGIEKLGGGHQEPDSNESAALRKRRTRLFLAIFHWGTIKKL